jgi:lipoprotein NlpD
MEGRRILTAVQRCFADNACSRWLPVSSTIALLTISCATVSPKPFSLNEQHQEPELMVVFHTVEANETLYRIAKAYQVSVEELMLTNGLDDVSALRIGMRLAIPGDSEGSRVEPFADNKSEAKADPGAQEPSDAKTKAQVSDKRAAVQVGRPDGVLQWPLRGVLYARFGNKGKEPHDGIDLAAPAGTPVKTALPGTVMFAGEQKGYGLIVLIDHSDKLVTLYAHNRDLRVKTGQTVREGQVVSTVGDSGRTSGPHLHFEVRQNGVPVDPLKLLGPIPQPPLSSPP